MYWILLYLRKGEFYYEKNVLVNVTENNIDGCGSNASVLLSLLVPNDKKAEELIISLQTKLNEIKKQAIEDDICLDTDDMIINAISDLDVQGKFVSFYTISF